MHDVVVGLLALFGAILATGASVILLKHIRRAGKNKPS